MINSRNLIYTNILDLTQFLFQPLIAIVVIDPIIFALISIVHLFL